MSSKNYIQHSIAALKNDEVRDMIEQPESHLVKKDKIYHIKERHQDGKWLIVNGESRKVSIDDLRDEGFNIRLPEEVRL